ncbi:SPFH domain-containing protein [Ideonella sp. DXS29W]|uniref:SPFH domain-containing protein n=2 Tax=Ideonella lacteola TaxID=2984193 RepID=A0ABU9BR90_9BURK
MQDDTTSREDQPAADTAAPTPNSGWTARLTRMARATGIVARRSASQGVRTLHSSRVVLLVAAAAVGSAYVLWQNPPLASIEHGDVGVRSNRLTGSTTELHEGSAIVLPGLHTLRTLPLRDQVYRPQGSLRADGESPFQSVEGLSLGVDLSVRYALDPTRVASMAANLPNDLGSDVVQPAINGVIYKVMARYTVREIFSSKRAELQQAIETELKPRLAADGVLLKGITLGKVDLPEDYRRGMDRLLAEELAAEKMRYTLALKEKQVEQTALEAQAEGVRREKQAEAAAKEQVIAARAQEEAMKHVLPFKQKQIEQRQLEAEAEKQARVKAAEASAQARRIEAQGEADSRQKLADAEAYRMQKVGQANSEQMAREGALITRHPLLIQKTLADKLSDKVQVIIAPPPADGGFIGSTLLGTQAKASLPPQTNGMQDAEASQEQ